MIKNLRSLIQENFPLELRIQIELLSRRRDLVNKEKHEELIKLLQSFNIEGVVPLGPGTNRYAFKLNGFVVKVATDHDGKIDNFKEFKMAKRLYPYVTKIYEVSENGTLLVAEYIQPFASYTEMCGYSEKIRDILTKLSSVYLIGDVGITSKNFANWGLRIGSDDPVCLDFAYVYEVSSELFICRYCNTNSMLVPNKEFTELHCPNKACNRKYLFEDIRAMIGNDIHSHEIGDLTQEGYRVIESGISTELDETRSNYLARRKEKTKEPKKSTEPEIVYEPFVMDTPIYTDFKGGKTMSIFENSKAAAESMMKGTPLFQFSNGVIIPAKAVAISTKDSGVKIVKATECDEIPVVDNQEEFFGGIDDEETPTAMEQDDDPDEGLAFSGSIDPNVGVVAGVPIESDGNILEKLESMTPVNRDPVVVKKAVSATVLQYPAQEPAPAKVEAATPEVKVTTVTKPAVVVENKPVEVNTPQQNVKLISDNFKRNAYKAFSKLSDRIGAHMHELGVKDVVASHIRDKKMYPEGFYKGIQNAVFRSLMIFCQFDEKDVANYDGKGTHKVFTPPSTFDGTPFQDTAVFVSRFWDNRDINSLEVADDIMLHYRDRFQDYQGIQNEWIPLLETRIKDKMPIDANGAKKIADIIRSNWCVQIEDETEESPEEAVEVQPEPEEEIAFSGAYDNTASVEKVEVAQNPTEDEYDEEETGNDDDYPFCVEIYPDDDYDIIKVNAADAFGPISIPYYVKLENVKVNTTEDIPSIADDRNGVWDWLIHMVPDMMFRTRDPQKWLEVNTYNGETNQLRIVIMNENKGEYIMGIYYLVGIFIIDDEGNPNPTSDPVILAKLNKIIRDDTGYGGISHLQRSLSMEDLIRDEEYINDLVVIEEDEDPDQYDDPDSNDKPGNDPEDSPEPEESEAEQAAIKILLEDGRTNNDSDEQESSSSTSKCSFVEQHSEDMEIPEFETFQDTPQPQPQETKVEEPETQTIQPPTTNAPGVFMPIRRKKS